VIPAAAWVWGIDTGSTRAGFGFASEMGIELATTVVEWRLSRDEANLSQSLRECYSAVYTAAEPFIDDYPPATIIIEQATGRHPNPSLIYHGGVICLAVAHATGMNPWLLVVTKWKLEHKMDGINLGAKADLTPWGDGLKLPPDDDQRAAAAIALAGRRIWNGTPTTRVSPAGTTGRSG
jgi:hypothetical protein